MLLRNTIKVSPILALAAVLLVAGGCSSQQQATPRQLQPAAVKSQPGAANGYHDPANYAKNVHWCDEFGAN
jgi:hypothetical protein